MHKLFQALARSVAVPPSWLSCGSVRTRSARGKRFTSRDIVVVLDPTLLKLVNVEAGLKQGGTVIVNTHKPVDELRKETGLKAKLATVDASTIAVETMRVPITNTTMLGALLKATGLLPLQSLRAPIDHRFGPIADKNMTACTRAFEETKVEG